MTTASVSPEDSTANKYIDKVPYRTLSCNILRQSETERVGAYRGSTLHYEIGKDRAARAIVILDSSEPICGVCQPRAELACMTYFIPP